MTAKAAFYSFGCRTNKEEIDAVASSFQANGFEIIYDKKNFDDADFIIVNTCSVTLTSQQKNFKFVDSLKKKYPNAKIVVTGCLAQQSPKDFQKVEFVIGNAKKNDIFNIISKENGGCFVENLNNAELKILKTIQPPQACDRTRFSIKIQEGCASFCSYCIVPYLRGTPKSANFNETISLAKDSINLGYNEIVLAGTHIGQYQNEGQNFLDVAKKIISINDKIRLRLSSMNPDDCDEKLFEFMAENPQICRHLHVAVQSLSPEILTLMNRNPKAIENLFENLQKYRKFIPELNLGGDFIVGFPNESEENFIKTKENIQKFGFNYGHVFMYSLRPQTPAAAMKNQIPEKIKKQRSEILRELFVLQRQNFANLQISKTQKIIIETERELSGITQNYLRVKGEKNPNFRKNQIVEVVLRKYNSAKNFFEADLL
ncbi:MAG: MiaB/RimO family radical SAM methylthiotransferase [Chitinispirillales bacterium]|jgi:threonylcarbamoyladenosine tRNA methylthiotransferase MtaB|nr:MiaB/RimO family radical SAM methylthiotransferase [Chitinispirillales bacterium]